MQTALATTRLKGATKPPQRAASVGIAAASAPLRQRLEQLARGTDLRVVPSSSNHDVLLFGVGSDSNLPESATALHLLTVKSTVCILWAHQAAPLPPVSRLLQAGISAILPVDIDSAQFRAALDAVRHGLQVIHPLLLHRTREASTQSDSPEELTGREQQVLAMMADGLGNKEIAARLGISTHTVKFHISSILGKLGADSRTEAVSIGMRTGRVLI